MAQKDILEKILLAHADVFADCVNVFMYEGQPKLRGADLCPAPTESFYQGRTGKHSQFCDRSFFQMQDGKVALAGADGEALRFVDDVALTVYHMRNLPEEVRDRFTSDIGFVVDYLNTGSFEGRGQQQIVHAEALCEMMEALTKDTRFTDMIGDLLYKQEKGERIVMCEYIDMLEARGEERGEGRLASLLSKLYALGRDEDAKLAVNDKVARGRLYEELGIVGS